MSGQMDGYVDSVLFYRSSLMIMRTGKSKLMRSLVGAILLSIGRFFFLQGMFISALLAFHLIGSNPPRL